MKTSPYKFYAMPYFATIGGGTTQYKFVPFTESETEFDSYVANQERKGVYFEPEKVLFTSKKISIPGVSLYVSRKNEYGSFSFYLLHTESGIPLKNGSVRNLKRLLSQIAEFLPSLDWTIDLSHIIVYGKYYKAVQSIYGF